MYLLDTSALIEIFDNTEVGNAISEMIGTKGYSVSTLTLYELGKRKNPSSKLFYFLQNSKSAGFDEKAAAEASSIFKAIKDMKKPVNEIDILIAGTAISNNLELISCDSDFGIVKKVSSLKLSFFKK